MKKFIVAFFCLALILPGTPAWSFSGSLGMYTKLSVNSPGVDFQLVAQCQSGVEDRDCGAVLSYQTGEAKGLFGRDLAYCNQLVMETCDSSGCGRGSDKYRQCRADSEAARDKTIDQAKKDYNICLSKC